MELNITSFFTNCDAFDFSHSQAEGGPNAGRNTWNAAKDEAKTTALLSTEADFDEFRAYVKGFGAWEEEEIVAWDADHCNALLIQMISGDMREGGLDADPDADDWKRYEKEANEGGCSGRISKGDDGEIYYYVGD